MLWGFYREQEEFVPEPGEFPGFGFLENVSVGDAYNLYDFLHGCCDQFAAALSDFFGYEIEYVLGNDGNLIHAYCVRELANGDTAYIDARGITTDAKLFFDEFADWCDYDEDSGVLFDLDGECQVSRCDTGARGQEPGVREGIVIADDDLDSVQCSTDEESLFLDNWGYRRDDELYQFLKVNCSYYNTKHFEREYLQVGSVDSLLDEAAVICEAVNKKVVFKEGVNFEKE